MTMEHTLTVVATDVEATPPEPYSVAWWESRTPEDLRDIINRGFAGGPMFKAANAEIERRAREEVKRLREIAALERERRNRLLLRLAGAVAALAIALMWIFA